MSVTPPTTEFADVDLGSLEFWGTPRTPETTS
jgi:hypothetical protein